VSRPYPAPPHLVAGFVLPDPVVASSELDAVVAASGPPEHNPPRLDVLSAAGSPYALELTLSGELVGMPPWVTLPPAEQDAAEETLRFLGRAFVAACEALDPTYAGAALEWRIPAPADLRGTAERLPGDLFWSSRLDERDGALRAALEGAFGVPSRALAGGRLLAIGGLLEPGASPPRPSLAVQRSAAARLATALGE